MAITPVSILSNPIPGQVGGVKAGSGLNIAADGTITLAAGGVTNTEVSATAAIAATKLSYTAPYTGAVARTVNAALTNVINLKDFGAVGNGTTDDTAALIAAVTALNANGGGTIYVPTGIYKILNTTTQITFTAGFVLTGDGPGASQFNYIDNNRIGNRNDFLNVGPSTAAGFDCVVKDITINGDWGAGGNYNQNSMLLAFNTTGNILLDNVNFSNSRFFAASLGNATGVPSLCASVIAKGCRVNNTYGDGISIRGALQTIVTGCYFNGTNDDAVACHVVDDSSSPVQNYAVISNNNFIQGGGIAVLGAKHTVISGNSFTRIAYSAIRIEGPAASGFPEGNTNNFSINVSDNVIDTVFDANVFSSQSGSGVYYIRIAAGPTTSTTAGYPNNPDSTGSIVSPYPYWYQNGAPTLAKPDNGAFSVVVSGNTCMRSLVPTAAYTDYGYGQWIGRNGPVDPAITNADIGLNGTQSHYEISGGFNNYVISNNVSYGASRPISIDAGNTNTTNITNGKVIGNVCSNYLTYGIYVNGLGDIAITDNMFDADPLQTSAYRSPTKNGTWVIGGANQVCALARASDMLVVFNNNHIKNVYQSFVGTTPVEINATGNVLYANPVSTASLSNIGIADFSFPVAGNVNTLVVWQGNPSAANYGTVLNVCLSASTAVPTSGTYLTGWVVINTAPTVQGTAGSRYIVNGWTRITSGSSHVLNTDWVEMRSLTGT
jgi:hypothetical protein